MFPPTLLQLMNLKIVSHIFIFRRFSFITKFSLNLCIEWFTLLVVYQFSIWANLVFTNSYNSLLLLTHHLMPCILSVDSNKLFRWDIFIFGILEIFPTEGGVLLSESVKLQYICTCKRVKSRESQFWRLDYLTRGHMTCLCTVFVFWNSLSLLNSVWMWILTSSPS